MKVEKIYMDGIEEGVDMIKTHSIILTRNFLKIVIKCNINDAI